MTVLRHAVGKSTLKEGIAVPKALEKWIGAPAAGQKKHIILTFENGRVRAILRRLANAREHVQIKYENKEGLPLRKWLASLFSPSEAGMEGEYLELERVALDTFRVHAFPMSCQPQERLTIVEWILHRTNERALQKFPAVKEIPAIVQSVEFSPLEGQAFYNRRLSHYFAAWKWQRERRVVPQLPLKSDFAKASVQVEVEFGNARTYYQDYIKFLLAFDQKLASLGVLIVPTEAFAQTLCAVGLRKAMEKGRSSYSGMIHIEKVRRELPLLSFLLKMPLAIAGIGVHCKNT